MSTRTRSTISLPSDKAECILKPIRFLFLKKTACNWRHHQFIENKTSINFNNNDCCVAHCSVLANTCDFFPSICIRVCSAELQKRSIVRHEKKVFVEKKIRDIGSASWAHQSRLHLALSKSLQFSPVSEFSEQFNICSEMAARCHWPIAAGECGTNKLLRNYCNDKICKCSINFQRRRWVWSNVNNDCLICSKTRCDSILHSAHESALRRPKPHAFTVVCFFLF